MDTTPSIRRKINIHLFRRQCSTGITFHIIVHLKALEDVNSAATAVTSKAANLLDAGHVLRLVRGRSTLGDGLGALAALLEDVAAAKLAVERAGLDARLVALDLEGSGEASGSDSESKEVLEVHF